MHEFITNFIAAGIAYTIVVIIFKIWDKTDKEARKGIKELSEFQKIHVEDHFDNPFIREKLFNETYVECSTCGCLVKKDKAIKVQSMVDKYPDTFQITSIEFLGKKYNYPEPEKEIKTTYYCLHCNPNKNEKKKTPKKINRKR